MINLVFNSEKPWGLYDKIMNGEVRAKVLIETDEVKFISNKAPIVDGDYVYFTNASIHKLYGKNLSHEDFPMKVKCIHVRKEEKILNDIYKNIGL